MPKRKFTVVIEQDEEAFYVAASSGTSRLPYPSETPRYPHKTRSRGDLRFGAGSPEIAGIQQTCHPERSCRLRSARQRGRRTPMVQSPQRRRREFSPTSRMPRTCRSYLALWGFFDFVGCSLREHPIPPATGMSTVM